MEQVEDKWGSTEGYQEVVEYSSGMCFSLIYALLCKWSVIYFILFLLLQILG